MPFTIATKTLKHKIEYKYIKSRNTPERKLNNIFEYLNQNCFEYIS